MGQATDAQKVRGWHRPRAFGGCPFPPKDPSSRVRLRCVFFLLERFFFYAFFDPSIYLRRISRAVVFSSFPSFAILPTDFPFLFHPRSALSSFLVSKDIDWCEVLFFLILPFFSFVFDDF